MDWVKANDTLTLVHRGILPVFIETQDGTSLSGEWMLHENRCILTLSTITEYYRDIPLKTPNRIQSML
jgi:hypothetical protein